MLHLVVRVMAEALIGLSLAGVLLGLGMPLLMRRGLIAAGDNAAAILISVVVIFLVGAVLLRPGSALRRHRR